MFIHVVQSFIVIVGFDIQIVSNVACGNPLMLPLVLSVWPHQPWSAFLLSGTTEHPRPAGAFFALDLESFISPRCPGFFFWGRVLRNQDLGARVFAVVLDDRL